MDENNSTSQQRTLNSVHHVKVDALRESWPNLSSEERLKAFKKLRRPTAEELFTGFSPKDQAELIEQLSAVEKRFWLRLLEPDDIADLIQEFPVETRDIYLAFLDSSSRLEVTALLAYAEDEAGGLMNPRFVRLRPDITVDVAVRYLRTQARKQVEHIHYAYVIDSHDKLLGTVSFRELLLASSPDKLVSEIMKTELITVPDTMDQETVSRIFAKAGLSAIPVVDEENHMKGIVTVDDVVDVVEEEATEDIHKFGGTEALNAPYFDVSLLSMIKKRAGWLTVLFVSEMFTATAMGYYEKQIERAVVLALFIPLIISSGGNSGSQASTIIIRSMALGEIKLRDWLKVFIREISTGIILGSILGIIGLCRILIWPNRETLYGEHYALVAATVSCSLIGIVLWGTLTGSMLPFVLRKIGLDPASASAPFVATLVDVTGIIIYFTVASLILGGILL